MMKLLEAILSVIVLLTVVVLTYRNMNLPDIETVNWKFYGFKALQVLDSAGLLSKYVVDNDLTSLNKSLANIIPAGISYDTIICSATCNTPAITAAKIASVDYYSPGNVTNFVTKRVILYLWSQ